MARSVTVKFNDKLYNATYNETTDEYEVELTAPETGGIYNAQIFLRRWRYNKYNRYRY